MTTPAEIIALAAALDRAESIELQRDAAEDELAVEKRRLSLAESFIPAAKRDVYEMLAGVRSYGVSE